MKSRYLVLFLILLLAACGAPANDSSSGQTSTDSASTTSASSDSASTTSAGTGETLTTTDGQVEIALADTLDGILNGYCLDIAGGNENVDPANGLQAHTCYSYRGSLGTDQIFDNRRFADNLLVMSDYDVCAQVASLAAGAEVGLATCDGSDLQKIVFSGSGTISPAAAPELCFTAAEESRKGRSGDHQIRDLSLETCSDDRAAYQQWVTNPETAAAAGATNNSSSAAAAPSTEAKTFQLEAWADNWFAAYLGDKLIIEDSVSIDTERSFNAETTTFEASYPLALNFILKDYKENETGLEYIGDRNQQMGDGGFILQLTDKSTGKVVAVTNADWACTVINDAPLDKTCESEANPVAGTAPCTFSDLGEPDGWKSPDFDDSSWSATTVHSAATVDPKFGYDEISWDSSAELIWGPDLETNNTVLCRVTVEG